MKTTLPRATEIALEALKDIASWPLEDRRSGGVQPAPEARNMRAYARIALARIEADREAPEIPKESN